MEHSTTLCLNKAAPDELDRTHGRVCDELDTKEIPRLRTGSTSISTEPDTVSGSVLMEVLCGWMCWLLRLAETGASRGTTPSNFSEGILVLFLYFKQSSQESRPVRRGPAAKMSLAQLHAGETADVLFCINVEMKFLVANEYTSFFDSDCTFTRAGKELQGRKGTQLL